MLEAITWKRLGLHTKPILIVNVAGFYDSVLEQLRRCIEERFMDPRHAAMWRETSSVEQIIECLFDAPPWDEGAIDFAQL